MDDQNNGANKADNKPSWGHINSDLKNALDTWSELTEKMAHKLSPEEEQLREIKSILGSLKDKLKEFDEDEAGEAAPVEPKAASTEPKTASPDQKPPEKQP